MVFRAEGTHRFKVRVTGKDGHARTFSTGTDEKATADDIERFVQTMKARRQWERLDLILSGAVKLPDAYDAEVRGDADAFWRNAQAVSEEVDLDGKLAEWRQRGAEPVYIRMVRSLIPAGVRFPVSSFRRKALSDHLASLTLGVVTKRKYRTAFSMFARWLIEQELIETNPARDVELPDAPRKTLRFLSEEQAKAVIPTIDHDAQCALEALMFGSGIEWQAAMRLTRRDIDPDRRLVHAYGSKNVHRDRWIEVTESWCWDLFWAHARTLTPNAHVFTGFHSARARERHHRHCRRVKVPLTSLHQYRHAFAVMWIRRGATGGLRSDGRDKQWLKNQLGHSPASNELDRIYGVYLNAVKLSAQQESRLGATDSVTAPHVKGKVKRAK